MKEIKIKELYNLDQTISKFIYPRLKKFKENTEGMPVGLSEKDWNKILNKMIYAFKKCSSNSYYDMNAKTIQKVEMGLDLFRRFYRDLWW